MIHFTDILLAMAEPLPQWLNFLVMTLALMLVGFASFLWFALIRKKRRRRRRKRGYYEPRRGEPREHYKLNPTLAETGELPPIREEKKTETTTPPPP